MRDGVSLVFADLVRKDGEGGSPRFLIVSENRVMLIDPGGDLNLLLIIYSNQQVCQLEKLDYIFARGRILPLLFIAD